MDIQVLMALDKYATAMARRQPDAGVAYESLREEIEELESDLRGQIYALDNALRLAIDTAEGLAEQQAMGSQWYVPRLEKAREALPDKGRNLVRCTSCGHRSDYDCGMSDCRCCSSPPGWKCGRPAETKGYEVCKRKAYHRGPCAHELSKR